jgi:hypothetical protein
LGQLSTTLYGQRLAVKVVLVGLTLAATVAHVVLGRSRSRPALTISRVMAGLAFLLTVAVFFAAARLVSG